MRLSRPSLLLPLLAALCGLVGVVHAGELAPGLARQMDDLEASDEIRVLVVLVDQVDAPALARQLRAAKATRSDAHREVVAALQETAVRGQAALLTELGVAKSAGGIRAWHPHWLINALVVTGRVDAIRELARRPDVERIEPDLVVEPAEPVTAPVPAKADGTIGTGVVAIGADRVWYELGIDGTGVVVGVIDSGIDGSHPALADRWRGNFAPAAECWLDAAEIGDTDFPVDRRYHGTHVTGILTGQAPGDSIGVAPGALWIGSNALNHPGSNEDFDNAILATLEFMADPDGNPATSNDVPAVVNNSWGVHSGFAGYYDCDSRWWDAIDACEAAGVVLVWSVGNEGPASGTVRSPADRAASATNCFSVGSTDAFAPYAVNGFSSRGPSDCGGEFEIKPEVTGPGADIRSAEPGGGYTVLSGTSMAGPHVAGVVALMRQANPDADVETIKQVLMDTALDRGTPGEDNDYGHGLVDAYAAVTAIMAGVGVITGNVTDLDTGEPVAGALIRQVGTLVMDSTDAEGHYLITMPEGPATFTVNAFGFEEGTLSVTVVEGDVTVGDLVLTPLPTTVISGLVQDEEGRPLVGATVTALDTPLPPAEADETGLYLLEVPVVAGAVWQLRAARAGYGAQDRNVAAPAPVVVDFVLEELAMEDFETGDFSAYFWRHEGDAAWTVTDVEPWQGEYSARTGVVGDGQTSELLIEQAALETADLEFHLRVSSEEGYDQLRFYVDGVLRSSWSGEVPWTHYSLPVAAGPHVYRWIYIKDGGGQAGADAAWIDDVIFPPPAEAPVPVADIQPLTVAVAARPDLQVEVPLTIANPGQADLTFVLGGLGTAAPSPATTVPYRSLAKGEADPRTGDDVLTAGGGPDGAGRLWMDSNQPGGPTFAWDDISGWGTDLGAGDDDLLGPFDLGFTFPFHGATYDQVYVGSNGYLTFLPSEPEYTNQGIPHPAPPNALVAAFWDDLDPSLGGSVLLATEPGRCIVQFNDVAHFGVAALTETFQVVLHQDGTVDFRYLQVGDGSMCTVGLENAAGDDGLEVAFNCPCYLQDGLAIRYAPVTTPSWLDADPISGMVPAGGELQVLLLMDTAGLAPGDYATMLHVATNDPAVALVSVPVDLRVDEPTSDQSGLPGAASFTGAAPNPFNPTTYLLCALPRTAPVSLRVYDVSGRLVRILVDGPLTAGHHRIPWDGRDGSGRDIASGVYFARLQTPGFSRTRSLVLVR